MVVPSSGSIYWTKELWRSLGPKRQISIYNQFFHFVTAVGQATQIKKIEGRFFANLDLSAVRAGLYAVYQKLVTRIRMYQAKK